MTRMRMHGDAQRCRTGGIHEFQSGYPRTSLAAHDRIPLPCIKPCASISHHLPRRGSSSSPGWASPQCRRSLHSQSKGSIVDACALWQSPALAMQWSSVHPACDSINRLLLLGEASWPQHRHLAIPRRSTARTRRRWPKSSPRSQHQPRPAGPGEAPSLDRCPSIQTASRDIRDHECVATHVRVVVSRLPCGPRCLGAVGRPKRPEDQPSRHGGRCGATHPLIHTRSCHFALAIAGGARGNNARLPWIKRRIAVKPARPYVRAGHLADMQGHDKLSAGKSHRRRGGQRAVAKNATLRRGGRGCRVVQAMVAMTISAAERDSSTRSPRCTVQRRCLTRTAPARAGEAEKAAFLA